MTPEELQRRLEAMPDQYLTWKLVHALRTLFSIYEDTPSFSCELGCDLPGMDMVVVKAALEEILAMVLQPGSRGTVLLRDGSREIELVFHASPSSS